MCMNRKGEAEGTVITQRNTGSWEPEGLVFLCLWQDLNRDYASRTTDKLISLVFVTMTMAHDAVDVEHMVLYDDGCDGGGDDSIKSS